MKKLFIIIISVYLSSLIFLNAFQTEVSYALLEAGQATPSNVPLAIYYLSERQYEKALEVAEDAWLKEYLKGLVKVTKDLVPFESEHFVLHTPPDQTFLRMYALPALESAYAKIYRELKHKPSKKIHVEIYPNKDDFSLASTLTPEILKRSGAIGICKFHRLMIVSPQDLPLGYRWLDALSHEYIHLVVNEIADARVELWLQEGTARYFETAYRLDPPHFLSANQKNQLLEALEEDKLISFARMSPSLVYLKDQEEVSLAFAEVSHAISTLIKEEGNKKFTRFLRALKKKSVSDSFLSVYKKTSQEFERDWQVALKNEKWEKSKGVMSDKVQFDPVDEYEIVGADIKGQLRLGDQMRQKGRLKAALIQYQKALKVEPDNAVVLLKVARTHIELGETENIIPLLKRATEKNPNYGTPHIELAKWLTDPHEKIHHLLEANSINPFNPEIHALLSQVYSVIGNDEKGKQEQEIAVQLSL